MDYQQISWDEELIDDCSQLIRLGVREDLDRSIDLTTVALVAGEAEASANLVVREAGVVSGLPVIRLILTELNIAASCTSIANDGDSVGPGQIVAQLSGPARDLLTAERLILNFVGRLSGVASLTARYVHAAGEHPAKIYDTRKTTPGWRRLEKYAVRCGGGNNHRTGLFDGILIKDNHLAQTAGQIATPADAVARARQFLDEFVAFPADPPLVEIEVDTLAQLESAIGAAPDIVLLDNMTPEELATAVAVRDQAGVATQLEASGGITLETIAAIAATGVDRISIGALTHSATALDVGLDWSA